MRTLHELIDLADPGWPVVQGWIAEASNDVEVLPLDRRGAEDVLVQLQVTTRSPMGAIAYSSGGILVDHGWLRILASGHDRMRRTLASWNGLEGGPESMKLPGAMLVADDVVGGFFAMNGGAFDGPPGNVHYFAPDTLNWQDLGVGYSPFVQWACSGDLEQFYGSSRWPGWTTEIAGLSGDRGLANYPFLWAAGPGIQERSRRDVPMDELWGLQMDLRDQLNGRASS